MQDSASAKHNAFTSGLLLDTAYGMRLHEQHRKLHRTLIDRYDTKLRRDSSSQR